MPAHFNNLNHLHSRFITEGKVVSIHSTAILVTTSNYDFGGHPIVCYVLETITTKIENARWSIGSGVHDIHEMLEMK